MLGRKGATAQDRSAWLADIKVLRDSIRQSSVDIPIGGLCSRDLWNLLAGTMMGHHPIRGKLRPRDIPLHRFRGNGAALLSRLHSAEIPQISQLFDCRTERFGSWLVVAILLERAGWLVCGNSVEEEMEYGEACWLLLKIVSSTLASDRKLAIDDYGKLGASILAEVAGINPQQTHGDHRAARASRLAQEAAATVNSKGKRCPVDLRSLRWLTIKTDGVQRLLDCCKRTFLMRGLSIWCAQVLCHVRDTIECWSSRQVGSAPKLLLITDADAITKWIVIGERESATIATTVRSYLSKYLQREAGMNFIEGLCPRLVPWAKSAIENGACLLSALPELSIHVGTPMGAEALFRPVHEAPPTDWERDEERTGRLLHFHLGNPRSETCKIHRPCDYVEDDHAIFSLPPPWWDAKGSFGWRALVWGHAGAMQRLNDNESLRIRLNRPLSEQWVHHGDWIKKLERSGMQNVALALIKMDGDNVGLSFMRRPPVQHLAFSLGIAAQFDRMLFAAARSTIKAISLQTKDGVTSRQPLPIDIQYIAGDDHLYCIPHRLVPAFFGGMERSGKPIDNDRELESISVAVIFMPLNPAEPVAANDLAARLVTPGIKLAKGRDDAEKHRAAIDRLCRKHGMKYFIRELDVPSAHRGSRLLHGLEIHISPQR